MARERLEECLAAARELEVPGLTSQALGKEIMAKTETDDLGSEDDTDKSETDDLTFEEWDNAIELSDKVGEPWSKSKEDEGKQGKGESTKNCDEMKEETEESKVENEDREEKNEEIKEKFAERRKDDEQTTAEYSPTWMKVYKFKENKLNSLLKPGIVKTKPLSGENLLKKDDGSKSKESLHLHDTDINMIHNDTHMHAVRYECDDCEYKSINMFLLKNHKLAHHEQSQKLKRLLWAGRLLRRSRAGQ